MCVQQKCFPSFFQQATQVGVTQDIFFGEGMEAVEEREVCFPSMEEIG